ncbi:hypothetical protein M408DRAFT_327957 [Serendipita vermifera MAFF 305830]|uniref:NAD(P)-binding protein n=1 Tax=Serendipita vermifera MAFF 305830 TaxID=933852 RepID=A0A0C3BFV5_SERVB|nr:hypothetical protein M408DRAFT_327957 [Serendipita vermifera MAFF 305830]
MFAPFWEFLFQHPYIASATSILTLSAIMKYMFKPLSRVKRLSPTAERVLIVGATSGVGRNLANLYAKRGTKVCIIGRRQAQLEEVRAECIQSGDAANIKSSILAMAADMTSAEDLVAVREYLEKEWGGVDTIVVCAGVSALRPLLDVAHSPHGKSETSVEAVKLTGEVAQKAISGNFTGPLLTAVTFIPQLQRTSQAPAILLISSVAALIPAPSRSLYCSSKAASLMLFRSLAIEHPSIAFNYICPGTIEGSFRASAVDGGDVREALDGALKIEEVASRCMRMVDHNEGLVMVPWKYTPALWLSLLVPWFTDRKAAEKYGYTSK